MGGRGLDKESGRRGEEGGGPNPIFVPLGLVARRATAVLEHETGLGAAQWFTLVALSWRDGLGQAEVSQAYEMDPAQVTRTGQALEKKGLVRRERDAEDKRVVRMYLTEKGRRLVSEKRAEVNGLMDRLVRKVMSQGEIEEMRRMLWLLAGAMKE